MPGKGKKNKAKTPQPRPVSARSTKGIAATKLADEQAGSSQLRIGAALLRDSELGYESGSDDGAGAAGGAMPPSAGVLVPLVTFPEG